VTKPLEFHAELRKHGDVVVRGPAVGVFGGTQEPGVIRFDGEIYVRTGKVIGSGESPTYRVYEWEPHGMMRGTCEELLVNAKADAT
jgi:hypothetical protein